MLISCKCSNFVASTSKLQRSNSSNVAAGGGVGGTGLANGYPGSSGTPIGEVPLSTLLSQVFQQKYPRDFVFYSQFMDFFKHVSPHNHTILCSCYIVVRSSSPGYRPMCESGMEHVLIGG